MPRKRKTEREDENVTETQETEAAASEEGATNGRRGRPRPQETLERDQRVYDHLGVAGPKTKKDLSTELGMTENAVYLSIYRLRRDGQIVSAPGQRNVWQRADGTGVPEPAPVVETAEVPAG